VSRTVLDASGLLALLNRERGAQIAAEAIADGASMSAVNFSEVVAKLTERGVAEGVIRKSLETLGIDIIAFDLDLAYAAGLLRGLTMKAGLSFGDRACLALATHLGTEALTADRTWSELGLDVTIRILR
jgi:PIN domain nuclease of toxin-antitoxin system